VVDRLTYLFIVTSHLPLKINTGKMTWVGFPPQYSQRKNLTKMFLEQGKEAIIEIKLCCSWLTNRLPLSLLRTDEINVFLFYLIL
jgi:hypothetical protein